MSYLVKAIRKLKPNSEFSFTDDDYSTIKWDVLEGEAPTQKQIDDAIKQTKADEITETKTKALAKSALLDKLGITEDEAKLLLS
jgi:hypothetical protein